MKLGRVECLPVAYPEPNDDGRTRHLLFVRLTAEDGTVGWGEAVTMWPEASTATAAIIDALAPLAIGRDPREHADIRAAMAEHMWWYGVGGIASFALSALDMALWDLAGKADGASLLTQLGGPAHDSLPVIISCHAMQADLDAMAATMAGWVSAHQASGIKVGFGKKGDARLGVSHDRDVAFVRALRGELGSGPKIMIDIGAAVRWDVQTATERCAAFEPFDIDWIEEPLGADDPVGYAKLRSATGIRLAYGEREWTPRGIERIVATSTVDVVGVDPGRCEGITGWLCAQRFCAEAGVEINAHAFSSAVVTAASLALSLSSPNCRQLEIKPLDNPMQHELVASPLRPDAGLLRALDGPGLGVEVDETVLGRYTRECVGLDIVH